MPNNDKRSNSKVEAETVPAQVTNPIDSDGEYFSVTLTVKANIFVTGAELAFTSRCYKPKKYLPTEYLPTVILSRWNYWEERIQKVWEQRAIDFGDGFNYLWQQDGSKVGCIVKHLPDIHTTNESKGDDAADQRNVDPTRVSTIDRFTVKITYDIEIPDRPGRTERHIIHRVVTAKNRTQAYQVARQFCAPNWKVSSITIVD